MTDYVRHGLRIEPTRDELSRQRFVSEIRRHILGDLASEMRSAYEERFSQREAEARAASRVRESRRRPS